MGLYILCFVLFCLGVYCMLAKRNLVKIAVGLAIADSAVNLFLVLIGYRTGGRAPIYAPGSDVTSAGMVDPLPQALVLTSIVIGLATTALLLAIAMRIYGKYGTYDISDVRELKG